MCTRNYLGTKTEDEFMKKFFKFVGIVTSICALLAGIGLFFKKFCGKKCIDCDEEEIEDLEEIEESSEDTPEPEEVEDPEEGE